MTEKIIEIKEIHPNSKILFINMSPTSEGPSFKIASGMIGNQIKGTASFEEMMLYKIDSPALLDKEKAGSLRQTKESCLDLPNIENVAAVVITGSPFSASLLTRDLNKLGIDREGKGVFLPTWQKELAGFIRESHNRGKPMLGVCFGAEMIAEALGGKVRQVPKEVGFCRVNRVSAQPDPVFDGIPESFVAITNHSREIVRVPDGAAVLAENKRGVQAFRVGNTWGVQFHPEKTANDAHELEQSFDPAIPRKILSNFLQVAWHGIQ